MFNIFTQLQNVAERTKDLRVKVSKADKATKKSIRNLMIFSASLFLIILFFQIFIVKPQFSSPVSYENEATANESLLVVDDLYALVTPEFDADKAQKERYGIGFNLLDPVGSIVDPINEALSSLVGQVLGLFNNFVGSTPNIAETDGNIYGLGSEVPINVDKFYNVTNTIAWLLLPLLIVINGATILVEGSFKGQQLLMQLGKKILIFIVAMVITRYFFIEAINLINQINLLIIQNLIGNSSSSTLSEAILTALGIGVNDGKLALDDGAGFNVFAQAIIWAGLFFFLCMLLFQFIIRFFHLLLHMVLFPIFYTIALLPGGGSTLKGYIEEIVRTLVVQPVFLIGLAIVLEVIRSGNGSVTKLVLGLGALTFLNTIPIIIAKASGLMWAMGGGFLSAMTLGQAAMAKKNIVAGVTGEKSGSLRAWGFKKVGEGIANGVGVGGGGYKNGSVGITKAGVASKGGSVFKQALNSGGKTSGAFEKLGMSPLDGASLKPESKSKTLFSNSPDFGAISDVSLKDSDRLSSAFMHSNFDSSFGSYPMTESPASINQLADLSGFTPSNPTTTSLIESSVKHNKSNVQMGKTFDSSNSQHWGHLSTWYAKNESLTNGKPVESYQKFINNPSNKKEILKKGMSEGYFRSQGINTLKVADNTGGKGEVNKYYQVKKPTYYARNSSAKAKQK
jgi:hypothetical protein